MSILQWALVRACETRTWESRIVKDERSGLPVWQPAVERMLGTKVLKSLLTRPWCGVDDNRVPSELGSCDPMVSAVDARVLWWTPAFCTGRDGCVRRVKGRISLPLSKASTR